MKVFRLGCDNGHDFEGWFASGEDFDRQLARGDVSCPLCESRGVAKLPSAPYVNTGARAPDPGSEPASRPAAMAPGLAKAMEAVRNYVLANTVDVGRRFPEVARRMHYGEEAARGIRGRVTPAEAEALRDEGVDAVALPSGLALGDEVH